MRAGMRQLFSGTSTIIGASSSTCDRPKTPRSTLDLRDISMSSVESPHISPVTEPSANTGAATSLILVLNPASNDEPTPRRSASANSSQNVQVMVQVPRPSRHRTQRTYAGTGLGEQHLADPTPRTTASRGTRRRRKQTKTGDMYIRCFPGIKNRQLRTKIISCLITGMCLVIILAIYLGLVLSKDESQEFHILLILMILVTTVFFCQSLIGLWLAVIRSQNKAVERPDISAMMGPGLYANPVNPIPVAMVRDEEAAGIDSQATKYPPPAYGLWRESVRVDPDRIFWQRNEGTVVGRPHSPIQTHGRAASRPPSYISENGTAYIIEANPSSTVLTTDAFSEPHPSERGRTIWTSL